MSAVNLCREVPDLNSDKELHGRRDTILCDDLKKRPALRRFRQFYPLIGKSNGGCGFYLPRTAIRYSTRGNKKRITSHEWRKFSKIALFSAKRLTQEVLKSRFSQLDQQVTGNVAKDLLQGLEKKYPAYKEIVQAVPHLVKLLPAEIQPDALIEKSPKALRVIFLLAQSFGNKYDRESEARAIEQD